MTAHLPRFAPFDLRVGLRLVTLVLVWKTCSLDYTNLLALTREPRPVFWAGIQAKYVSRQLDRLFTGLWTGPADVQRTQVLVALALVAGAATLNRWLIAAALGLAWAFLCYAALFTAPMFDAEACLCYLLLVVAWPGSWHGVVYGGRAVTPKASACGTTIVSAFGIWYFYAGLSKLLFDPRWIFHIHLENTYATSIAWGDIDPGWCMLTRWVHQAWRAAPWLSPVVAAAVLGAELGWPLAIVSRPARRALIALSLGLHFGYFLSCSVMFIPMTATLLATVIPWRRLGGPPLPDEVGPAVRWRILGVVAVLLAWHTACVVKTRNYYPILNWGVFGWVQPAFDGPIEVYRLGYRDPSDGEIRPIPHDVGGFMEGRYVGRTRMMAKEYLTEHDPDNRALVLRKIRVLLDGMRPYQSNRWLLGNLALPTHGICIQDPPRATPDCPFFALRGEAEYVDGVVTFQWLDVEPLDFPPP